MDKRARENIRTNVAILLIGANATRTVRLNEQWAKAIVELIDQVDELEAELVEIKDDLHHAGIERNLRT